MRKLKLDFAVVGTAKGGTTALHEVLVKHSSVTLPKQKETNYFSFAGRRPRFRGPNDEIAINRHSIVDWDRYQAQFAPGRAGTLHGEVCPSYLYFENAAVGLHAHNPEMKIVVVLRDPVQRAFSNYLHLVRDGRERLPFFEALSEEERRKRLNWEWFWFYCSIGRYAEQVSRYLDLFGPERVLVVDYEEAGRRVERVAEQVLSFLDLPPLQDPSASRVSVNVSGRPPAFLRAPYNVLFGESSVNRALRAVLPAGAGRRAAAVIKRAVTRRVAIDADAREFLREYYAPLTRDLRALLQREFALWAS
jgi:glycosyltransferase involved in cell wall biosynthesis